MVETTVLPTSLAPIQIKEETIKNDSGVSGTISNQQLTESGTKRWESRRKISWKANDVIILPSVSPQGV